MRAFAERLNGQPIDLLINNAGIFGPLPFVENIQKQRFGTVDLDVWADVLRVNTLGTINVTEALVDNVAASEKKMIVTLSSGAGSIGGSDRPAMAYTTSKAALNKAMTIVARTLQDRD
ncbi:MAG TPA: short-chain dehydrogenase, partial [Actinobacteria bacterium]|nr:short-chain dehydrogenase [Actinomycetota bacterium]